jgi:hypothetical protein
MGWFDIFKNIRTAKSSNEALRFFFGPPETRDKYE